MERGGKRNGNNISQITSGGQNRPVSFVGNFRLVWQQQSVRAVQLIKAFKIWELGIILVANGSYWYPSPLLFFCVVIFSGKNSRKVLLRPTIGGEGGGDGEEETTFPHVS